MNRKLTHIILATVAALSLTGCSGGIVENDKTETVSGAMFVRHKLGDHYSVLEEIDTGICYLEYEGSYGKGITVMLNPDGTPRTWDEMEGQDEKAKSE